MVNFTTNLADIFTTLFSTCYKIIITTKISTTILTYRLHTSFSVRVAIHLTYKQLCWLIITPSELVHLYILIVCFITFYKLFILFSNALQISTLHNKEENMIDRLTCLCVYNEQFSIAKLLIVYYVYRLCLNQNLQKCA